MKQATINCLGIYQSNFYLNAAASFALLRKNALKRIRFCLAEERKKEERPIH